MEDVIKPDRHRKEEAENEKKKKKDHFGTSKTASDKTAAADLSTPPVSGRLSGDGSGGT